MIAELTASPRVAGPWKLRAGFVANTFRRGWTNPLDVLAGGARSVGVESAWRLFVILSVP